MCVLHIYNGPVGFHHLVLKSIVYYQSLQVFGLLLLLFQCVAISIQQAMSLCVIIFDGVCVVGSQHMGTSEACK